MTIERKPDALVIVEGVAGVWSYHIAHEAKPFTALCGARTMRTNMRNADWGVKSGHIPETYCKRCAALALWQPAAPVDSEVRK